MSLYARRWYQAERFDGRIVSLQIFSYDYTDGANEVLGETSLTWDMAKGSAFFCQRAVPPGQAVAEIRH
jgi:hypothetical protein